MWGALLFLFVAILLLIIGCSCKVSSKCSRLEEEQEKEAKL